MEWVFSVGYILLFVVIRIRGIRVEQLERDVSGLRAVNAHLRAECFDQTRMINELRKELKLVSREKK